MSTTLTPPRPPVAAAKSNGTVSASNAASKPNGTPNGNGAQSVGYTKQDVTQLRGMILAAVAKGEMTIEQASKDLAEMVEVRSVGVLRCKVGKQGGVSVYGVNAKWPVTLYAEQWERLFAVAEDIKVFIQDHAAELKRKQRG